MLYIAAVPPTVVTSTKVASAGVRAWSVSRFADEAGQA